MGKEEFDNSFILNMMHADSLTINELQEECPKFIRRLKEYEMYYAITILSTLLTMPMFAPNRCRIEALLILILLHCKGKKKIDASLIDVWLNCEMKKTIVFQYEDPNVDVFIGNILTEKGNFRIINDNREGSDFYLQRLLNLIKALPDDDRTILLFEQIHSMLVLSDFIIGKNNMACYTPCEGHERQNINVPSSRVLKTKSSTVTFTEQELNSIGITVPSIRSFVVDHEQILSIQGDNLLFENYLHDHPIIEMQGHYQVVLPNVIASAIQKHILRWIISSGYSDGFDEQLRLEYRSFFENATLMGSVVPLGMMTPAPNHIVFCREVDTGYFIQVIAVISSIRAFLETGKFVLAPNLSDNRIHALTQKYFVSCTEQLRASAKERLKKIITLVVFCGYGMPQLAIELDCDEDCDIEYIAAHDYETFSYLMQPTKQCLWQLIEQKQAFTKHNNLSGVNTGLLSLYGFWARNGYLLMTPEMTYGHSSMLCLAEDFAKYVREHIRRKIDRHACQWIDGSYCAVERMYKDVFLIEDEQLPAYIAVDSVMSPSTFFLALIRGQQSNCWICITRDKTKGEISESQYRIWDAVVSWFARIFNNIEIFIKSIKIDNFVVNIMMDDAKTEPATGDVIGVYLAENNILNIIIYDEFSNILNNSSNFGEKYLLKKIIFAILWINDVILADNELLSFVDNIIPNKDAKFTHVFYQNDFRDYTRLYQSQKVLLIDEASDNFSKIGLGCLVADVKPGDVFNTVQTCTQFLNNLIDSLYHRIQIQLKCISKEQFIIQALEYIEACGVEKLDWDRTYRALLALHNDQEAVFKVASNRLGRCFATSIALRLLIEIAICESPLSPQMRSLNSFELRFLMCDMNRIFIWGGVSNAIFKQVIEPTIGITNIGDVVCEREIFDEVEAPIGRQFASDRLSYEAERYDRLFDKSTSDRTFYDVVDHELQEALSDEFGLPYERIIELNVSLQEIALNKHKAVFVEKRSLLFAKLKDDGYSEEELKLVFDRFSLRPRDRWNSVPDGFEKRDWCPWLFGRELSLTARPIIQLDLTDDPTYVIAPGLIREIFAFVFYRFAEADYASSQCKSKRMRQWLDKEKSKLSHAFVLRVAKIMENKGFKVLIEKTLPALLNKKISSVDMGDVDVLAWREGCSEIYAIECKDFKFAKTINDMSELLNNFRGESINGKKDLLKKHLDRCDFLNAASDDLKKKLKLLDIEEVSVQSVVCFSQLSPTEYLSKRFNETFFITENELKNKIFN